jgi:AbiV family abortive infection protein
MKPPKKILQQSISKVEENAKSLLEDAKYLFDMDRYSTASSLAILAQEEIAKAFLLQLVEDDALPWLPEIQRTMAKHQCKHLLGIVMEWIPQMDFENLASKFKERSARHQRRMDWYERLRQRRASGDFSNHPEDPEPLDPQVDFPKDVADAINILRHEEVERYRPGGSPWTDEDWAHGHARKIAKGWLDTQKQSGFYVDISKTGQIGLHPSLITRDTAEREIAKTESLREMRDRTSDEYRKLTTVIPMIFANLTTQVP